MGAVVRRTLLRCRSGSQGFAADPGRRAILLERGGLDHGLVDESRMHYAARDCALCAPLRLADKRAVSGKERTESGCEQRFELVFLHAVAQDVIGHAHLPQASLFISRTLCAQSGEGSAGETHSQDPAEKMRAAHQPGR